MHNNEHCYIFELRSGSMNGVSKERDGDKQKDTHSFFVRIA